MAFAVQLLISQHALREGFFKTLVMNRLTLHLFQGIILLIIVLLLAACDDRVETGILPKDFTKEKRELLGDLIELSLESNLDMKMLPDEPPYDIVYDHIQRLYNQVTNEIRLDTQSPEANQWNKNREWKVDIINEPEAKFAYIIPGGHVCLSTGLLLSLDDSYELYYILAFEASLVHGRYLLNKLFQEYRIDRLDDFLKGVPESDGVTFDEFANGLKWIQFDETIIEEVDALAVNTICKSSRYSRLGIIQILEVLEESDQWLNTRPSYDNRYNSNYIENLGIEKGVECGDFRFGNKYEDKVLANLPP